MQYTLDWIEELGITKRAQINAALPSIESTDLRTRLIREINELVWSSTSHVEDRHYQGAFARKDYAEFRKAVKREANQITRGYVQ